MNILNLQTIAILVILSIFVVWSLAMICDDLFLGNKGVMIPDQFWGLLGIVLGSLFYALRNRRNGNGDDKEKKEDKEVPVG